VGCERQAGGGARLAFKANTDDIRFSPALEVVKRLLEEGAVVQRRTGSDVARQSTLSAGELPQRSL